MKKFLSISMLLASLGMSIISAEAKTAKTDETSAAKTSVSANLSAQPGRWRRPNVRTIVKTTRHGRTVWRETIRVTRWPNGRVTRQTISRVRVR